MSAGSERSRRGGAGPAEKQGSLDLQLPELYMGEGEEWARARGYRVVVGLDEAGRGPLAGPVVAAAVHLPSRRSERKLVEAGLDDSKRLGPELREELALLVGAEAHVGIGSVDAERIDEVNILQAAFEAMTLAIRSLCGSLSGEYPPDLLLVDGNARISPHPLPGVRQHTLVKGDRRSIAIAAASVVAKVHRDEIMRRYDEIHPGYGFASHKGYLSPAHSDALSRLGPSPIHRRSFRGVLVPQASEEEGP